MNTSSFFPPFLGNPDQARVLIEEALRSLSSELEKLEGQWVVINLKEKKIIFNSYSRDETFYWLRKAENNDYLYTEQVGAPSMLII